MAHVAVTSSQHEQYRGLEVAVNLFVGVKVTCAVWLEYWVCRMNVYSSETCHLIPGLILNETHVWLRLVTS